MSLSACERGILFAVTGGTENFLERRGPGPQGALGGPKGAPVGPQGVILLDGFRAEFQAPEGEIGREYHPREALGELYLSRGVPGWLLSPETLEIGVEPGESFILRLISSPIFTISGPREGSRTTHGRVCSEFCALPMASGGPRSAGLWQALADNA